MCTVDPAVYLCEGSGVPRSHVLYLQGVTLVRVLHSYTGGASHLRSRRVYGC
jgi:hypothetical protein